LQAVHNSIIEAAVHTPGPRYVLQNVLLRTL